MAVDVKETPMRKKEILDELERLFGTVPDWIKETPEDVVLELWGHLQKAQTTETPAIPPKQKELMSLAVASALGCPYCTYFHTEAAKLHGATEDEIKGAIITAGVVNHPPVRTVPGKASSTSRREDRTR